MTDTLENLVAKATGRIEALEKRVARLEPRVGRHHDRASGAEIHTGRLVVFGHPDPNDETHNCDEKGCGSTGPHILEYLSPTESAQELYRLRERVAELEWSLESQQRTAKTSLTEIP